MPENEPEPELLSTLPPPTKVVVEAGKDATAYWNDIGPQLVTLGMFTELDVLAFELLCVHRSLWQQAASNALKDLDDGWKWQKTADTHALRVSNLLSHFGMSPATRSKVTTQGSVGKNKSVMAKLAAGRGEPGK